MTTKLPINNGLIISIFQHFAQQDTAIERSFRKATGLKTSDMKTAATSGCLPDQRRWKTIVAGAQANGWTPPTA